MGMVNDAVPVTGFAANFSPMPRTAPPPLGRVICGAATVNSLSARGSELAAAADGVVMVYDRAACAVPADDERTRRAGLFVTTGAACARLDAPSGVEQSAEDGTIARLQ